MSADRASAYKEAILKALVIDGVLMAVGVVLYLTTNVFWYVLGAALLGAIIIYLLLAQAAASGPRP